MDTVERSPYDTSDTDPADGIGTYAQFGAQDRLVEAAADLLAVCSTGGDTDGRTPLWRVQQDWACNVLGLDPDNYRARSDAGFPWPAELVGRVIEPNALRKAIGRKLAE